LSNLFFSLFRITVERVGRVTPFSGAPMPDQWSAAGNAVAAAVDDAYEWGHAS